MMMNPSRRFLFLFVLLCTLVLSACGRTIRGQRRTRSGIEHARALKGNKDNVGDDGGDGADGDGEGDDTGGDGGNEGTNPEDDASTPADLTSAQSDFFSTCQNAMLSEDKLADGTISQREFATEFVSFCTDYTLPTLPTYQCPPPNFAALPVVVQLVFTQGVCPREAGEAQQRQCLDGLISLGNLGTNFGYIFSGDNYDEVEQEIGDLCFELVSSVFLDNTPAPTVPPTAQTANPTSAPIEVTQTPELATTSIPTANPTISPTATQTAIGLPTSSPSVQASTGGGGGPDGGDGGGDNGGDGGGDGGDEGNGGDGGDEGDEGDGGSGGGNDAGGDSGNGGNDGGSDGGTDSSGGDNGDGTNSGGDDGAGTGSQDGTDTESDRAITGDSDSERMSSNARMAFAVGGGISLFLCCCCCCFIICCRRRREKEEEEEKKLGDIEEDISVADLRFLPGVDALADTGDASLSSSKPFVPYGGTALALGPNPSKKAATQAIARAIDQADWNDVYLISSNLADREDLSSVSTAGREQITLSRTNNASRARLDAEDEKRAKTLDRLFEGEDWTGIAVTSALYAGESDATGGKAGAAMYGAAGSTEADETASNSTDELRTVSPVDGNVDMSFDTAGTCPHGDAADVYEPSPSSKDRSNYLAVPSPPTKSLDSLRAELDNALGASNWSKIIQLSSEIEDNNEFQAGVAGMAPAVAPAGESEEGLEVQINRAVHLGDWALVSYYANRIRNKMGNSYDVSEDSTALVPAVKPSNFSSTSSIDTSDTALSKKGAIEKLVNKQHWKGVSIMAGLYNMESSRNSSAGMAAASPPPANDWHRMLTLARREEKNTLSPEQIKPNVVKRKEEVRLRRNKNVDVERGEGANDDAMENVDL